MLSRKNKLDIQMLQIKNWEFSSVELDFKDLKIITENTQENRVKNNKWREKRYQIEAKACAIMCDKLGRFGQPFCSLAEKIN